MSRTKVFVSYSHQDRRLFGEFKTMLAPAVRQGLVDLWDDTRIRAGAKWRDEIAASMAAARVAVLLVSPDFLASEFIQDHELPPLLAAAEREGVTIFWVCLRDSLVSHTPIEQYQAAHDVGRPLASLRKAARAAVLTQICEKLIQELARPLPAATATESRAPQTAYATPNAVQQPSFGGAFASIVSSSVGQVAPPRPRIDELFEILADPEDVPTALFNTERRDATTPYLIPYVQGREGMADVQDSLAGALAAAGGRLLVSGRGGIGKTREVAEYAREMCRRRWRVLVAKAESDDRLGAVSSLPAELADAKVLLIIDNLHIRMLARSDGEPRPYADRLDDFLASVERFMPGDLRAIAITRSEPHFRKALALDPAMERWRQFGVFELADFTTDALAGLLTSLAARAEVPLAADARALVANSDRTPETLANNIDNALREAAPLSNATWLPTEGESWNESYAYVRGRFAYVDEVLRAVRLVGMTGLPPRVAYVRTLSRLMAGGDTAPALEGLVDKGLLGLRHQVLRAFSEEQLRDSLGTAALPASLAAAPRDVMIRAILDVDDPPAVWLRDLAALADALLRSELVPDANRVANHAIAKGADFAEAYATRGRARFVGGEIESAIADFSAAIERAPDDPAWYAARGGARMLVGDRAGAAADADRTIALDPRNGRAYASRAVLHFQQNRSLEADADFTAALDRGERDAMIYFARGIARYQLGEFAAADADLTAVLELGFDVAGPVNAIAALARRDSATMLAAVRGLGTAAEPPAQGLVAGIRGYVRMMLGNFAGAEEDYTTAITHGFAGQLGRLASAISDSTLSGLDFSRDNLAQASAVFTSDVPFFYLRGLVRLERGRAEAAEADFSHVIESGTADADAFVARGKARARLQRPADAEADFTAALARGRTDAQAMRGATRLDLARFAEAEQDLDAAIAAGVTDTWVIFCRGTARMQMKKLAAAEADFSDALARGNDKDGNTWGLRGACRLDQGRLPEAEADLTNALALGYARGVGLFLRGVARYHQQKLAEAEQDFSDAIADGRTDVQTVSMRGAARLDQNRSAEAEADFDAAIAQGRGDAGIFYVRGLARYRQGRLAEAEQDLALAIELGKDDADARSARASVRFDREEFATAVEDYDAAIAHGRADERVFRFRAAACAQLGRYADAEAGFTEAIARGADDPDVFWRRGMARFHRENAAGAREDFTAAIARGNDEAEMYYIRGLASATLNEHTIAESDFAEAVARKPAYASAHAELGQIYLVWSRMPDAERAFTAALPGLADDPTIVYRRGVARYAQGDFAGAAADYETASTQAPDNPAYHTNLAMARVRLGEVAGAEASCARAAAAAPEHADALGCRGVLHIANGRMEEAFTAFAAAVRAANEADWQFWLGLAALLTGRFPDAEEAYRKGTEHTVAGDAQIALVDLDYWTTQHASRMASHEAERTLAAIRERLDRKRRGDREAVDTGAAGAVASPPSTEP